MSVLSKLFSKHESSEAVMLIDVGLTSVAGAYAVIGDSEAATSILYTRRLAVELRQDEPQEKSVLRALRQLGEVLVREGAPVLLRATGSGSAARILISVDSPWQRTSVRTEYFEHAKPFTFTRSFIAAALEKTRAALPEHMLVHDSVIGTILNGYETTSPFDKQAHRAEIVVLTSLITETVGRSVADLFRELFHTSHVALIAGSSLRFQSMRTAFPHENNALIIDATGTYTSIALIRKGLFVAIVEITDRTTADASWIQGVKKELIELSRYFPLPRTIFLIAHESQPQTLQQALSGANLGELWLSENPPQIVSVATSHLSSLVKQTVAPTDLMLTFMAIFAKRPMEF